MAMERTKTKSYMMELRARTSCISDCLNTAVEHAKAIDRIGEKIDSRGKEHYEFAIPSVYSKLRDELMHCLYLAKTLEKYHTMLLRVGNGTWRGDITFEDIENAVIQEEETCRQESR